MIELILAENIPEIAKSGDSVILKDNGTFEIKKAGELEKDYYPKGYVPDYDEPVTDYSKISPEERRERKRQGKKYTNEPGELEKEFDPRIEKYLSIDKEKSWALLTKFYNDGHLDSYKVLKDFINKIAICPDVTEKFDKVMEDWMKSGEADVSSIEKIINSCKKEEGNVEKAERSPEQLRQMEEARKRQQNDDEAKIKPIGKSDEIIEEVLKNKPDRDTKWVDEMVERGDLPKQKPNTPDRNTKWVDDMVSRGDLPKQKPGFPKPKTRKV